MKSPDSSDIRYAFLDGGGEMGELTRSFDWSSTPVGPIHNWSPILRTTVSNLLHTNFPMFLWWGDEMIQFYNDGYRPSLGENGKHPRALGLPGRECWPEIWEMISPLIDKVRLNRESFFLEDQLVPIFRNGKIEDVYWTFSYSPVIDDDGEVAGVLVICNETTRKVNSINELLAAQTRFQQSEANLFNVFMQAPSAMAILEGPDHIFRLANDKYMQLVGRGRNVMGLDIRTALPELANTGFYELLDDVLKTEVPYHGQEVSVFLDKKGDGHLEEAFVDFVYQPYYKGNGEAAGVLVHAVDITEQVVFRKRVEQSEQRLRNLISEAPVATALYTGLEMKIEYANDAMIKVWGKDRTVIGKTLKESLPELDGQPFHQLLQDVFTTGVMYWGKEDKVDLMINGKMETGYFNFTYKPLRNLSGEVYGILNMAIDVTDQYLYKRQVEQSEATLKGLILNAPVAMCLLIGPEYVVETVNDNMIRLWGRTVKETVNKPVFEVMPDTREQGLELSLRRVFETGETYSASERPITLQRNGKVETLFQNLVFEPYKNVDGNIIGILVISIDVTNQVYARQQIEEIVAERTAQLANANADLQRSNAELSQFAYIASHDLQEPARKITTFIEMLSKSLGEIDPRSRRYIEKIEHSSERMLALIRDVLNFSQVSTSARMLSLINLNEVLQIVLSDFELSIEAKNATIESDELPTLRGIAIQINQLFSNLISNSLKFVYPNKAPVIRIRSRLISAAEVRNNPSLIQDLPYYEIEFADNGIGFNQANAGQIFDIFQRLHGKAEYEGTGIGLAICKKIVQNHNGDIKAESVKGDGAIFRVYLPAS